MQNDTSKGHASLLGAAASGCCIAVDIDKRGVQTETKELTRTLVNSWLDLCQIVLAS